jgi:GDP-L-fucose synthase
MREFLWSEEMAEACVYIMEHVDFRDVIRLVYPEISLEGRTLLSYIAKGLEIKNLHINVGTGEDITIRELAYIIKEIVGFNGDLIFDISKPDGIYRKVMDISRIRSLGWKHKTSLKEGINQLYEWYLREEVSD